MYQKQQVPQEEGNIDSVISSVPIALDVKDKAVKKVGKFYLPFSTGFEIECDKSDKFDVKNFEDIVDIMDVNCDSHEQRFRIPKGIKGLNCLYKISQQLKINSLLNPNSGIHYHVDFTKYFHLLNDEVIKDNKEWILNELDSWNYKGNYNSRNITKLFSWVRIQPTFKTLEFRIGEMTFDYSLLFKRITHCNAIVKKLSKLISNEDIKDAKILSLYSDDVEGTLKNRKIFI